jgi:hypothetical protein
MEISYLSVIDGRPQILSFCLKFSKNGVKRRNNFLALMLQLRNNVKHTFKMNYKETVFEFMIKILLERINCQCLFCEHDNETSVFVEGKNLLAA